MDHFGVQSLLLPQVEATRLPTGMSRNQRQPPLGRQLRDGDIGELQLHKLGCKLSRVPNIFRCFASTSALAASKLKGLASLKAGRFASFSQPFWVAEGEYGWATIIHLHPQKWTCVGAGFVGGSPFGSSNFMVVCATSLDKGSHTWHRKRAGNTPKEALEEIRGWNFVLAWLGLSGKTGGSTLFWQRERRD